MPLLAYHTSSRHSHCTTVLDAVRLTYIKTSTPLELSNKKKSSRNVHISAMLRQSSFFPPACPAASKSFRHVKTSPLLTVESMSDAKPGPEVKPVTPMSKRSTSVCGSILPSPFQSFTA